MVKPKRLGLGTHFLGRPVAPNRQGEPARVLGLPGGYLWKERPARTAGRAREYEKQRRAGRQEVVQGQLGAGAVSGGEHRRGRAELEAELRGATAERSLELLDPQEQTAVGAQQRHERSEARCEQ